MIIDVIDLNFKTLHFDRSYDSARYKRGTRIYNYGDVQINTVKKDGDNYIVEAEVEGNHGTYNTKLKISKGIIKDCSCTCEDASKGYICKHIIATSMETMEPHYASTQEGMKKILEKEKEEKKRREEEAQRQREQLRKKQEYEQKYNAGLSLIETFNRDKNSQIGNNVLNLTDLYEDVRLEKLKKPSELATAVKLECAVQYMDCETLKVTFKIGQTRMYVLNNLNEFYEAYKNGTEIYYGKQLNFIPKRENFVEESLKLFDYIIKYCEMIEYSNKFNDYYRYQGTSNKEIYVVGDNIEELFKINNEGVILREYDKGDCIYNLSKEKLDIKCILKKEMVKTRIFSYFYADSETESEEIVLKLNISNYNLLYSYKNIYVFYKNKIYTFEKNSEYFTLFNIFKKKEKILIPEDKLAEFKQAVFPEIKNIEIEESLDSIAIDASVVNKLAVKVLLDVDDRGNILMELKFCYMDYEFNILETGYKTYVKQNNIVRDIPKETEIIKRVFMDGFELVQGRRNFIMKNEECIYDFLVYKIQKYMNDFEVLVTDKFKNKQVRQPKISNVGIRVDNGLLELDISKVNIDIDEIKNVLKSYDIKKKYHKLKNGDFLDLTENESLKLLDEITETLDIDYSKAENGVVKLPINRSFYLEKLVTSNKSLTVSKNESYTKIIDNIENSEISDDIKIDEDFELKLRDYQRLRI